MKPTMQLRRLLSLDGPLLVPGAYDGASARVVAALGHAAVYLTGFGMEASILGMPDIGLASQAEIVTHAGNIAAAVPKIPVISDADTGYGGLTNIHRTVRDFERAGIAGIHIEDQSLPKRCGGMAGRQVVPAAEMIARLNGYFKVGADMAMIAEPFEVSELRRLCAELDGPLAMVGGVPEWPESMLSGDELGELGVKLVLYACTGLGAALKAQMAIYGDLLSHGRLGPASEAACMSLEDLSELMGLSTWNEIETSAQRGG
jgi:2-methylisocitrate lyase-like PEP mutase family enzyme